MTAWFKTTSITVNAGESLATINDSAPAVNFESAGGGLKIGSFERVETAGLAVDSSTGKTVILLAEAWPHSTQTDTAASGFNTAASHTQSAKILREVSEDFTAELSIREKLYSSTAESVTLTMPSGATYNLRPWKKLESDVSTAVAAIPAAIAAEWQSKLQNIRLSTLMNPLVRLPLKSNLKGEFAGDLTFTRASIARYFDGHGVLKTAAINEARFEKSGYLSEGAATNIALHSDDATKWGVDGDVALAPHAEVGPDFLASTAHRVTPALSVETTGGNYYRLPVMLQAGATYTISHVVKPAGITAVRIELSGLGYANVNLESGRILYEQGAAFNARVHHLHGGWVRILMSVTAAAGGVEMLLFSPCDAETGTVNLISDGVKSLIPHSVQCEKGALATSMIKTTDTAVTRAADLGIKIPFSDNHPDIIRGSSTVVLEFDRIGDSASDDGLFSLSDTSVQYHLLRKPKSSAALAYFRGPEEIKTQTGFDYASNVMPRVAVVLNADNVTIYQNGLISKSAVSQLKASGQIPDFFVIGAGQSAASWNGHIKAVAIYDVALNADEIKFLHGDNNNV